MAEFIDDIQYNGKSIDVFLMRCSFKNIYDEFLIYAEADGEEIDKSLGIRVNGELYSLTQLYYFLSERRSCVTNMCNWKINNGAYYRHEFFIIIKAGKLDKEMLEITEFMDADSEHYKLNVRGVSDTCIALSEYEVYTMLEFFDSFLEEGKDYITVLNTHMAVKIHITDMEKFNILRAKFRMLKGE